MNKDGKVFLRLLTYDDITEEYLTWFKDPQVTKYLEVDGENLTKKMAQEYIERGKKNNEYYMYAICLKDSNKHIGNLKIGPINWKHNFSDLVIVIGDKECWGKGLASEAIKKGIEIAFNTFNIRKLSGGIYSENVSSVKAYTNAGYFIEGKLKKQFIKNKSFQDKIMIGCFNPKFKK